MVISRCLQVRMVDDAFMAALFESGFEAMHGQRFVILQYVGL